MLKNIAIAVLLLVIAFLSFGRLYKKSLLKQQKKSIDKEIIITPTSGEYSNRIVKFNKDNSIELGKNNELFGKRDGKWLVFDSTNSLQEIKWYQNGRLFFREHYIGDKLISNQDTFYVDSFRIGELSRPIVTFETDIRDSTKVVIYCKTHFPLYYIKYSCNSLMKNKEYLKYKNMSIWRATKKKNGEPLEFKVEYKKDFSSQLYYDRVDRYSLEY